ncbi:MAG: amidase [Halobacteria archaeon]|nr:amidase [Halobacteria archaeon]
MPTNTSRDDICFTSATELARKIRGGELSPVEVLDAYLDRIESREDEINAYITLLEDEARETAKEAEKAVESGEELGPLHGVPIALKDLRDLKEGVTNTFGCALFSDFPAPRTSVGVERLESAGAVPLGKTNVPEFGHKAATDNELIGPTATPFDTSKNSGGSSGGSAAAVAAGMAPVATGSDSGGSIRIPAALCGVYGLKPSFGLIPVDSRPNAFGLKTHHTVQGPLTRTVEDAALLMEVLARPHPSDPSSVPVDMDYQGAINRPIDDLSVAYNPNLDVFEVNDDVSTVVENALTAFEDAGASVEEVSVGHGLTKDELFEAILTTFSASLEGVAETIYRAFGLDIREYPDQISDSLVRWFDIAEDKDIAGVAATGIPRTQLFDAVQGVFEEYDVLVTPTLGTASIDLSPGVEDHLDWSRDHLLTYPFNYTGHPVASVPAGLTDDGLPVGMQIVGRRYKDDTVLAASAAFERNRPWHDTYPR